MKKVLFMCINMNIGGTEKSLISMLNEIQVEKYDITILMLEKKGGFLNQIPKNVNIKYVHEYKHLKKYINEPMPKLIKNFIKDRKYIHAVNLAIIYFITKISGNINYYYKYLLKNVEVLENEYDLAVAYAGPMDLISYFILNKVRAKKRAQWIHFDIEKIGFNINFAKRYYKYFDNIFIVSNEARAQLIKKIPQLKSKCKVFKNVVSEAELIKKSKEYNAFNDKYDGTRILTVGRLTEQKGQDIIPNVLKRLIDEKINVKWYCVGEGNLEKKIALKIKENKLDKHLFLVGKKLNPYPYFNECDLYVQPSRYEGFCITLTEAKIFKKPIIITNFVGSEQIRNNETGIIIKYDEDELYEAIKTAIQNNELRNKLSNNLKQEIIDNSSEVEKLYRLLE